MVGIAFAHVIHKLVQSAILFSKAIAHELGYEMLLAKPEFGFSQLGGIERNSLPSTTVCRNNDS